MVTQKKQFKTMDEYVQTFPEEVQNILEKVRETIRKTVPAAEETISYQIPTFKLDGWYLVYFAGYKNHVSLYPLPSSEEIAKELAPYKAGKGTVRFPLDRPIPYGLIKKMVQSLKNERARAK